MDLVLNQLENTSITPTESENLTHYDVLYKNWGKLGNQEERRREILEKQKSDRNTKWDKFRGILELVQTVEESSIFRGYNRVYYKPTIYVAGFNKAPSYSEVLMLSEWMIEKPSDFETDWMVVPAPKGIRALVVANGGVTRAYTKHGHLIFQRRSGLPGGNPADLKSSNSCVLDCFYQKKNNTLYVMDILAWNVQPMTDGEFEFRDYWMKSKFSEMCEISSINKMNEVNFYLLPKVSCDPESFNRFMMTIQFDGDINFLDGLLFFHKKAHYFSGETPLVGWLYPFMVPEVLGNDVKVNAAYMIQKPENYTNQAEFITEFNEKLEKKKKKRPNVHENRSIRWNRSMDTAEVETEVNSTIPNENQDATDTMEAESPTDSATKVSTETVNPKSSDKDASASMTDATTAVMEAESSLETENKEAKSSVQIDNTPKD